NVSFSASWIQRWFKDQTVDENIGIPSSAYVPVSVTDFGPDNLRNTADDRQLTFYSVLPAFIGKDAFLHTNCGCTQRYQGLEVSMTKRMSDRWQMMASYVYSKLDGDMILDPTNPNNQLPFVKTGRGPTTQIGTSTSAYDQPHSFKLLGSYQAPGGINIGANFQALSGLPRDRTLNVALQQGTLAYRVEPRGTYRYDTLKLL